MLCRPAKERKKMSHKKNDAARACVLVAQHAFVTHWSLKWRNNDLNFNFFFIRFVLHTIRNKDLPKSLQLQKQDAWKHFRHTHSDSRLLIHNDDWNSFKYPVVVWGMIFYFFPLSFQVNWNKSDLKRKTWNNQPK